MIQSKEISIVAIGELLPHPENMNKHSDDQINRLCKLIQYQGFRNPLIVQKGTNLVVAGNGRLMAAKKLGMTELPVTYQEFESEAQLYAFLVSDNSIASWAELDLGEINTKIIDFGPDFDLEMLGLKNFTIEPMELDDITKEIQDDLNKKYVLEITFPNDMEMMDIHDDLVSRGYIVKVKK